MSTDRGDMIKRLERVFPGLEMYQSAELFNNEEDCSPGYMLSWSDFTEELEKNGLRIVSKNTLKKEN